MCLCVCVLTPGPGVGSSGNSGGGNKNGTRVRLKELAARAFASLDEWLSKRMLRGINQSEFAFRWLAHRPRSGPKCIRIGYFYGLLSEAVVR